MNGGSRKRLCMCCAVPEVCQLSLRASACCQKHGASCELSVQHPCPLLVQGSGDLAADGLAAGRGPGSGDLALLAGISGVRFQLAESSSEIDADELAHSRLSAHRRAGSSGGGAGEGAAISGPGAAAIRSGGSSAPSSPGALLLRSRQSLRGDLTGDSGPPAAGPSTLGPGSGLPPRQPEPTAGLPTGGREALGNFSRERLGEAGAGAASSAPGGAGSSGGAAAAAAAQQRVLAERPALRPGPEGGLGGAPGGAAAAAAR